MSRRFRSSPGTERLKISANLSAIDNAFLGDFTWAAWVNLQLSNGLIHQILGRRDPSDFDPEFEFHILDEAAGQRDVVVQNTGGARARSVFITLPNSVWHHYAAVYIRSTRRFQLFFDGAAMSLAQDNAGFEDPPWTGFPVYFGTRAETDITETMDGFLAEVKLWSAALTQADIASAMVGTGPAANLVGYWHLCGNDNPELDIINGANAVATGTEKAENSPGFTCLNPGDPEVGKLMIPGGPHGQFTQNPTTGIVTPGQTINEMNGKFRAGCGHSFNSWEIVYVSVSSVKKAVVRCPLCTYVQNIYNPSHVINYRCSDCGRCYQCKHPAIYEGGQWFWLCKNGRRKPAVPDTKPVARVKDPSESTE